MSMRQERHLVIGLPATVYVGSDRYVVTIVDVSDNGKTISYTYPRGTAVSKARFRKGAWYEMHTKHLVEIGVNNPYLDPSF